MASHKYQHYIPAGHQALFSNAIDSTGSVYKYDSQKSIVHSRLQNPHNYGGDNHLYSYPDDVVTSNQEKTSLETDFFSQDGEFVRVVNKMIMGEQISSDDIYQISKYIAIMNNRHPSTINDRRDNYKDLTSTVIEDVLGWSSRISDICQDLEIKMTVESEDNFFKVFSMKNMLLAIQRNLSELCNINMNIFVSEQAEFILSDKPFVGIKGGCLISNTDELSPDCDYFLPLSKNICVHLNGYGQILRFFPISESAVGNINKLQIASANKFVIASSVDVLQMNLDNAGVEYVVK